VLRARFALSSDQVVGVFPVNRMWMQRIIASLLLSVFFLTPLAPAALSPIQPVAQHCVRQPLAKTDAAPGGMRCHEAAAHAHHSMANMTAASDPVPTDHQFGANGCCPSHDCCNSTVRAQWAHFVPPASPASADLNRFAAISTLASATLSARFDSHSGRAPPAL
jgi:hypothetical protein